MVLNVHRFQIFILFLIEFILSIFVHALKMILYTSHFFANKAINTAKAS